jgi:membrane-associated protein
MHLDVTSLIQGGGLLAITLIVYAESGLMVGFFLPGDTLLLSAGVLAAQGQFPIELTIALIGLAAILGDNTGYTIGSIMGKRLFRKKDGIVFRQEYVTRTEKFYEKHGAKTMMIAHFIPIVRSFAPLVAGVGKMPRAKFVLYDAIGDIAWASIVTLLGYWFGGRIPNLDHYILPTVLAVMIISFGPMVWHIVGNRETRQRIGCSLSRLRRPKGTDSHHPTK